MLISAYKDPNTGDYFSNNLTSREYRKCKLEDALKIIRNNIQVARYSKVVLNANSLTCMGKLILQQS